MRAFISEQRDKSVTFADTASGKSSKLHTNNLSLTLPAKHSLYWYIQLPEGTRLVGYLYLLPTNPLKPISSGVKKKKDHRMISHECGVLEVKKNHSLTAGKYLTHWVWGGSILSNLLQPQFFYFEPAWLREPSLWIVLQWFNPFEPQFYCGNQTYRIVSHEFGCDSTPSNQIEPWFAWVNEV